MQELINWVFNARTDHESHCLHRQCLLISHDNAIQQAQQLLHRAPASAALCWLGDSPADNALHLPTSQFRKLLGQEFDIAVYQAFAPFRPSALLALAGTIRQGGRLIIACPPLMQWPDYPAVLDTHFVSHGWQLNASRYLAHWVTTLRSHTAVAVVSERTVHLPVEQGLPPQIPSDTRFITQDQMHVYHAVLKTDKNAVITAPRGRGKSALLGEIAAALLASGNDIFLTSKHYDSVRPVIDRLKVNKELIKSAKGHFRHHTSNAILRWMAPDNPRLSSATDAILMVDEAASFPLPQLNSLTTRTSRCILTTTTDGYEGSGQGFSQRFIPAFISKTNACHYSLKTPIRWLEDDPLEQLTAQGLLFSPVQQSNDTDNGEFALSWCDFADLDAAAVRSVMQLLVQAHYQTSPDDMMRLIDAPDVRLLCATSGNTLVGATIINIEGGQRLADIASDIASGRRRVKGHLSAQRIALQLNSPAAATYTYWRINRIAVAQEHQGKGYGSKMVTMLIQEAVTQNIDAVTSSYGNTNRLARFWRANGLHPVYQGQKQDKSSGKVSTLVFSPISHQAQRVLKLLLAVKTQEDYAMGRVSSITDDGHQDQTMLAPELTALHHAKLMQFVQGSRDSGQCLDSLRWLAESLEDNTCNRLHEMNDKRPYPLLAYLCRHPFDNGELQKKGSVASKSTLKRALQVEVKRALAELSA